MLDFLVADKKVFAFALSICAAAFFAYVIWFRPAVSSALAFARAVTEAVKKTREQRWPVAMDAAQSVVSRHPHYEGLWRETVSRVVALRRGEATSYVMFSAPHDLWNARSLLRRRFNLDLADVVPNLLVGVGLLFTFYFLTEALSNATQVLTQGAATSKETEKAIESLLKVAGSKFVTSLAGLFASLIWTYVAKSSLNRVEHACQEVERALAALVPGNGSETLVGIQLENAEENLLHREKLARAEMSAADRRLEALDEGLGLLEEMLEVGREQSGTLKRFETDLAISIGNALNPQFEGMTQKLVNAINGLSEKLGHMNQDALEKMTHNFAAMLKENTETEMMGLKTALAELAGNLSSTAADFDQKGRQLGDAITSAGASLGEQANNLAQRMREAAEMMETAGVSLKAAMNDLDASVDKAAALGREGTSFVRNALDTAGRTVDHMFEVSDKMGSMTHSLEQAGGRLVQAGKGVQDLCDRQNELAEKLAAIGPDLKNAVERVSGIVRETVEHAHEMVRQTQKSMEGSSVALSTTVERITAGVTTYSAQVRDLHQSMDNHLAKAVGDFGNSVNDLGEAIEELSEIADGLRQAQ
ncbi:MAG: hypothetical protein RBS46_01650 [Methyloversatilis sp.]|jgi:uncharacterized protein YoxC|nr:hypothetical protein [Methyloversatilis sp.]